MPGPHTAVCRAGAPLAECQQRASGLKSARIAPLPPFVPIKAGSSGSSGNERRQQRRRQDVACLAAAAAPPSSAIVPPGGRGPAYDPSAPLSPMNKNQFPDIELPLYDPSQPRTFDLVVVGSGPAGLAVAERVAQSGFQVGAQSHGASRACTSHAVPACRMRASHE
jgi:hypothetical protein